MNARQVVELITVTILVIWNVWQYVYNRGVQKARADTEKKIEANTQAISELVSRMGATPELQANPQRCESHERSIERLEGRVERVEQTLAGVAAKQEMVIQTLNDIVTATVDPSDDKE